MEKQTDCNCIFDIFKHEESHDGITTLPTCQEIRDKNYNTMHSFLDSLGCCFTEKICKCFDGEEYEMTQIRGPKASGFFVHSFGAQTFSKLNGEKIFYFLL